jgi:hypothetical protein
LSAGGAGRDDTGNRRGLYDLGATNRTVKLSAVLFLLVLGYAYIFAFFMVKQYSGLTPEDVAATYVPAVVDTATLPTESSSREQPLDLGEMHEMKHTIDTQLLIQDSHIHIMMFAMVAALQTLIVLGLGWPAWLRDLVVLGAFGSGALDFSGQWLMKAGIGGFAWLTIAAGWTMVIVYVLVLARTLQVVLRRNS